MTDDVKTSSILPGIFSTLDGENEVKNYRPSNLYKLFPDDQVQNASNASSDAYQHALSNAVILGNWKTPLSPPFSFPQNSKRPYIGDKWPPTLPIGYIGD